MKATALALIACLSAACADEALKPIPASTVILGQVSYVPEPEEVMHGFTFAPQPDEFNGIPVWEKNYGDKSEIEAVKASCGLAPGMAARFAVVRLYYFQTHDHVGLRKRPKLYEARGFAVVAEHLPVERGNVVEIEMRPGQSNSRCPTIIKIKASSLAAGPCRYVDNVRAETRGLGEGAVYALDCPLLESEGWHEVRGPLYWGERGNFVWGFGYDGMLWFKPPPAP
jgi:hypothetical protein